MARSMPTNIGCPSCGQPFNAFIEQILDLRADPTVKERLLTGRINMITCPHCGYRGAVATPLLYHDPSKQLAIIYVPMELNLQQIDRERLIGEMTNAVMRSMPEDSPKGYLLQPGMALTMQGLLEQVLAADGITREMLDTERRKIELVELLAKSNAQEVEQLLADNQDILDLGVIELLGAAAQAASERGDNRTSLRLLNIRTRLIDTTEAGQQLKAQQQALIEATEELKALGEGGITREAFVELLVRAADNPAKIDAFAAMGRPLLDYTTFQVLTGYIDRAQTEEEKQQLIALRERLLAVAAEYERQARAAVERAADTLRMLLQAGDVRAAILANLERIDQTFLQILQANLEEARRTGNVQVSSRLKQIRDEVLNLIQQSAPPEIRLINELLSVEDEADSLELLRSHQADVNEELVEVMGKLADQLRESGNESVAQRLDVIRAEAARMIAG